jgi:hypothetical protein
MSNPNLVEAWLASLVMERLQKYLQNGRRLRDVPTEMLRARWIKEIGAWADNCRAPFDHREHEDIEAEMSLRKMEPPFDEAKEALQTIRRACKETLRNLRRDPDGLARKEQEIVDAIDKLKADADRIKS